MARSRYTSRPRVHLVTRNPMGAYPTDSLLGQIREHAELGERVRVYRPDFRSFGIARNGPAFIVLPVVGSPTPIGTYSNIRAAVMAGDRHLEWLPRVSGDDFPRGAA